MMGARSIPDVDVIIVAHNSGRLLLESVCSAVSEVGEHRVVVVDAESTDDSIASVAGRYPGVHVLRTANDGFAAANNRGIEATGASYVFLLNPDAVVAPGTIETLVSVLEDEPRAGIVGPRVLDPDGTMQAGSYGRYPTLVVRAGLAAKRLWRRFTGRPQTPITPLARIGVDWVTGAAMLVRRAAIIDTGPMDEGFFLYYEDIEWCHRMRDHGWDVLLEPAGSVTHHVGGSGGSGSRAAAAYRDSFNRYCDLYGLWALKLVGRIGVALRSGGRS